MESRRDRAAIRDALHLPTIRRGTEAPRTRRWAALRAARIAATRPGASPHRAPPGLASGRVAAIQVPAAGRNPTGPPRVPLPDASVSRCLGVSWAVRVAALTGSERDEDRHVVGADVLAAGEVPRAHAIGRQAVIELDVQRREQRGPGWCPAPAAVAPVQATVTEQAVVVRRERRHVQVADDRQRLAAAPAGFG